MKNFLKSFLFVIIASILGCTVSKPASNCLVPSTSIIAQVYDLCFLKNSTDYMVHPGVERCHAILDDLPNDCEHRILVKKQRCVLLIERNLVTNISFDECLTALRTEGLFVKGCEYPFTDECVERVNKLK